MWVLFYFCHCLILYLSRKLDFRFRFRLFGWEKKVGEEVEFYYYFFFKEEEIVELISILIHLNIFEKNVVEEVEFGRVRR